MSLLTRPPLDNRQIKAHLLTLDLTKEFEAEETSPLLSLLFSSPSRPSYGALHDLVRMAQNFNRIKEETKSKVCCEFVDDCLHEFSLLTFEQTNSLHLLSILRDRSRTLERLNSLVERGSKSLLELRRLGFIHSNESICRQFLCEKLCAVARRWDAMVEYGDQSALHDEHYRGFNHSVERNIELASNFAHLLFEETRGQWRFHAFDVNDLSHNNLDISSVQEMHLYDDNPTTVEYGETKSQSIFVNETDTKKDLSDGQKTWSMFDEFTKGRFLNHSQSHSKQSDSLGLLATRNPLFFSSQELNLGATDNGSRLITSLLKQEGITFESIIRHWGSNTSQTLDDLDDALEKHSVAVLTRNEDALLRLVRPHLIQHLESLRTRFVLLQDETFIDSLSKIGRRVLSFNKTLEMVDVESIFLELNHSIRRMCSLHQQFVRMHWDWLKRRDHGSSGQTWNKVREIAIILSQLLEGFSRLETFQWMRCVQTMNEGKTIGRVLQGSNGYISTMLNLLVNDETRSLARICQAGELLLVDLNLIHWNEHFDRFQTCVRFFHSRVVQDATLKHFFCF